MTNCNISFAISRHKVRVLDNVSSFILAKNDEDQENEIGGFLVHAVDQIYLFGYDLISNVFDINILNEHKRTDKG